MHLGREHSGDHTLVPVAIGPADERRTRAIRTSWSPSPPLTAAACTGGHTGRPHAAASGRPIQERTGAEGSDQTVVGDWPPPKTSGAGTLDIVAIDDVARDRLIVHLDVVQGPFDTTAPLSAQAVFAILVGSAVPWVDEVGQASARAHTHPAARTCE